jgi:ATP-binding cassette, subfamily F, member 3
MIKVSNLSFSFPQKDLYHQVSFSLEEGQHCAFIGTSGSGKSTLIDILIDPDKYMFNGTVSIDPLCRIGYVRQFSQQETTTETTVFEYIAETFLSLQKELNAICIEMETSTEIELLLEKYQDRLDAFEAMGGDNYESLINKKLNLANLLKYKALKVSELSGGEFKLIQVIREMLNHPGLMIMDEPDVFLDFENLNALKSLINAYKGIILVITHNRYLLNHCFNKIIHLENMEIQEFEGNYVTYNFSLLKGKIELQELSIADDEEIERNDLLIEKLRNIASYNSEAARGKSLKARVKIQERLEARRIKAPFIAIKQPLINMLANEIHIEGPVLSVNHYHVAFDELLLDDVTFEIGATDKVALIGANGTGKTTLLRDIAKNCQSTIHIDANISMAYLSQIQGEMLNDSNTISQEFYEAGLITNDEINNYLAGYGFDESIVHQKINTLSGGEKNMLQLAKICVLPANLLLLDEPTSHLDTYAQIALEKAIINYKGAVLMVSHDYYTIANCMDYVFIIENKSIRKVSIRKFRKMIYANHFDRDYLANEQKKKAIETKIELALKDSNFELAKTFSDELEGLLI